MFGIADYGYVIKKGHFIPFTGYRMIESAATLASMKTYADFWTSCPDKSSAQKTFAVQLHTSGTYYAETIKANRNCLCYDKKFS